MKSLVGAILGIFVLTVILVVSQPAYSQYSYSTPSTPTQSTPTQSTPTQSTPTQSTPTQSGVTLQGSPNPSTQTLQGSTNPSTQTLQGSTNPSTQSFQNTSPTPMRNDPDFTHYTNYYYSSANCNFGMNYQTNHCYTTIAPMKTQNPISQPGVQVTNPSIYNTSPVFLNSSRIIISSGAGSEGPNGFCVINHNCFNPSVMMIKMGTQVTWMNSDSVTHTVTSGKSTDSKTGTLFDQTVSPGKSVSITINNSGTINYFCKIHPWITGQLIVGSDTSNSSVQIGNATVN
jgi:plastocyanin